LKVRNVTGIMLAVLLLTVIGCSKTESKLIGNWQNTQMQEVLEFHKDKTGVFIVQGRPALPFRWNAPADDKVNLDVAMMGKTSTLTGKLDNKMFILEGNRMKATYRKIDN
jgi:hypothetical protein